MRCGRERVWNDAFLKCWQGLVLAVAFDMDLSCTTLTTTGTHRDRRTLQLLRRRIRNVMKRLETGWRNALKDDCLITRDLKL